MSKSNPPPFPCKGCIDQNRCKADKINKVHLTAIEHWLENKEEYVCPDHVQEEVCEKGCYTHK